MDNVQPVTKWRDGGGGVYDTQEQAIQAEARRIVRVIVCDAIDFQRRTVDVEALAERRNALCDALRKVERGA